MNLLSAYTTLHAVYKDGAYLSVLLNKGVEPFTEELVNRVLERSFFYSHTIRVMSKNPPRPKARLIIMMGFAMLDGMRKPAYAVIDGCVLLAKELELFETGYINALLKRFAEGERPVLCGKEAEEAEFNAPYEIIKLVKKDYPKAYKSIFNAESFRKTHVRLKAGTPDSVLDDIEKTPSAVGGFFVDPSPLVQILFQKGVLTYQSLSSLYAVTAVGAVAGDRVLDVCAAPGGKSVAMAEVGADVLACDLYPHRVELIKSYASRMQVLLRAEVRDGTIFEPVFSNLFDKVLLDAPCSGLGVLQKRKDIVLKRTQKDVVALCALQKEMLENASKYVKVGGTLVYSTCTVLKCENTEQVHQFLARHAEFKLVPLPFGFENCGEVQFLPDGKGLDGFYIAKMERV